MKDKVCLVTGATSGIGRVTAEQLAKDGATVVIIARNAEKGTRIRDAIRKEAGHDRVELIVADLGVQADVRRAAEEFKAQHDRLHVLVNNAGAMNMERSETADGLETTFAVNHLGYFLLTRLLLDLLEASAPSRIVNVASRAHHRSGLDLDDLQAKKRYRGFQVYCQSKLANVMFTYALARRLQGTGVTVNCLHPGVIASGFGKNNRGIIGTVLKLGLIKPFMRTSEQGAHTSLYLSRSADVEGVTGKYFDDDGREVRSSRISYDEDLQERLWRESERLTGLQAS